MSNLHAAGLSKATALTAEQCEIIQAAAGLLELLERVVPPTTIHYAVEQIRVPLQVLITQAVRVKTNDFRGDRA